MIKELATAGGTTMVGRGEITDVAWEQIEPLLPENGRKGAAGGEISAPS